MTTPLETWNAWHKDAEPKYPQEKVIQFCFRHFPPKDRPETRALDLGCGSGVHTVFMASEGFQVTGTDVSPVGVANTRRKLDALGLHAELRVEGIDVIDFPPNSFDLVVCYEVLEAAGPALARASLHRLLQVLKPGGRGLFVFTSDRDYRITPEFPFKLHGYTRDEVEEMFREGFVRVWIDRYISTYEGGKYELNDWLVTLQR
jgi:cyclopropane fatty-acyl-phospholipid synthase-like methyltransferase